MRPEKLTLCSTQPTKDCIEMYSESKSLFLQLILFTFALNRRLKIDYWAWNVKFYHWCCRCRFAVTFYDGHWATRQNTHWPCTALTLCCRWWGHTFNSIEWFIHLGFKMNLYWATSVYNNLIEYIGIADSECESHAHIKER